MIQNHYTYNNKLEMFNYHQYDDSIFYIIIISTYIRFYFYR